MTFWFLVVVSPPLRSATRRSFTMDCESNSNLCNAEATTTVSPIQWAATLSLNRQTTPSTSREAEDESKDPSRIWLGIKCLPCCSSRSDALPLSYERSKAVKLSNWDALPDHHVRIDRWSTYDYTSQAFRWLSLQLHFWTMLTARLHLPNLTLRQ